MLTLPVGLSSSAKIQFLMMMIMMMTVKANCFIEEVSRGQLTVPHHSTYEFVRAGLWYLKSSPVQVCCRKKLVAALEMLNNFFNFGSFSVQFLVRLANVLLNGIHKLDKDTQSKSVLYQTSIKKARLT